MTAQASIPPVSVDADTETLAIAMAEAYLSKLSPDVLRPVLSRLAFIAMPSLLSTLEELREVMNAEWTSESMSEVNRLLNQIGYGCDH